MIWEIAACVGCFFAGIATNYVMALGFKNFLTVYTEKAEAKVKADKEALIERLTAFDSMAEVAIRRDAKILVTELRGSR
jgi:hypothetical protein